jgi:hypothetical protein
MIGDFSDKVKEVIENYEDEIDLEAAQKVLEDHIASGAKSISIDEFLDSIK